MTQLQLTVAHQREVWLERAMLGLFMVFQVACITLIFLHDSQGGYIPFAIVTTFVKSVVIGAITIELLQLSNRLIKKHWLYDTLKNNGEFKQMSLPIYSTPIHNIQMKYFY